MSIGRGAMHNPWIFGQIADAWEGREKHVITAQEALDVFPLYYKFKIEDGATEMNAMGRMKQLAARLCKGFVASSDEDVAMSVRQALLTCQSAAEMLDCVEKLKDGIAREMFFEPERLVNLNGAKETELKFGDQFKGR